MSKFFKVIRKRWYLIIFVVLMTLPALELWTNCFNDHLINEKREKTPRPTLNLKEPLYKYLSAYEKYFNDNFGFREYLIDLANTVQVKVFNHSPNSRVVLGKSNYLFINNEVKDYNRTDVLSDKKIDLIAKDLSNFQKALQKRGFYFVFSVAPNKSSIYPEYMPFAPTNPHAKNNLDKLEIALKKHKVNYLDFRSLMLKNKDKYPLYYKRDTHWNQIASAIAANDIINCLGKKYPIKGGSIKFDDITMKDHNGDLDDLLGIYNPYPEYTCKVKVDKPETLLPKTMTYMDSFCEEVLPMTDKFFVQRMDMHNINTPVQSNFCLYSHNAHIVFFEIVERFIPQLCTYNFDVFNDDVGDLPTYYKPYDININYQKPQKDDMEFHDMSCTTDQGGGYYYASKGKDSYITWKFDKPRRLDYLYMNLSYSNAFETAHIFWSDKDSGPFDEKKSAIIQLLPGKTKYLVNFLQFDTRIKRLRINIGTKENEELNLQSLHLYENQKLK